MNPVFNPVKLKNFLLPCTFQIISDYCKNVHQAKPFSHIMMELFKKLIQDPAFVQLPPKDEKQKKNLRNQLINLKAASDDHK